MTTRPDNGTPLVILTVGGPKHGKYIPWHIVWRRKDYRLARLTGLPICDGFVFAIHSSLSEAAAELAFLSLLED